MSAVPRIVIITQGSSATIVASSTSPTSAPTTKSYPVTALKDDEIVDTNGAGDSFCGGFLGALVLGKNIDECIEAGSKMGAMNLGQVGAQFKFPKVQIL